MRPLCAIAGGALLALLACRAPGIAPVVRAHRPASHPAATVADPLYRGAGVEPAARPALTTHAVAGTAAAMCAEPTALPALAGEIRALWVTRWDYATAADVRRAITNAKKLGANCVLFQVRGAADAFYRSPYEPWARELGGRDPGFDPLAVAVAAAKAAGVQIHAYMNVFPVWKGKRAPAAPTHIWNAHRDWVCVDKRGRRQRLNDHYVVLNPAHPEARAHLVRVFRDVAKRYAVDGIHLDYVRYLSTDYSYDGVSLDAFRRATGATPQSAPGRWDQWRRDQVTATVQAIVGACRLARRGITMSAAVWRTPQSGYDRFLQDVPRWYRQGLIDWAFPMIYSRDARTFRRQLAANLAAPGRVRVLPGIGAYLHESDPAETARQVAAARAAGATGFGLFAYGSFFGTADTDGGYGKQDAGKLGRLRRARRDALAAGPLRGLASISR